MLSAEHEALLEVLRRDLTLWRRLLGRLLDVALDEITLAEPVSESLGPVVPVERRADIVLSALRASERLVIVLEVQLRRDPEKQWVWPTYLAAARDRHRSAAILVVVVFDRGVARWAAEPIVLGPGLSAVHPLVLGPDDIPVVTDPGASAEEIVVSALAHGRGGDGKLIGEAAVASLARLDTDPRRIYTDLILSALAPAAQRHMETLMRSNYAYQSDLFRRLVSEGRQEGLEAGRQAGLEEGREEGREKGREEGWRAALRAGVVVVLEARGIVLTIDDHGRLGAEHDLVTLQRWLTQAATARSFAEAVRALG